jgi:hypothetical protein
MADTSPLPELPMWQARSFWLTLVAAAAQVAALSGFDLFGFFGAADDQAFTDSIMQIVSAVAVVWAWLERRAPNFKLGV